MTRFFRRSAGILKIKILGPCLWFKENLGGIWQHLSAYWTIDPQGAADLRPNWGWCPHQCNRDGCFAKPFRTKVQMFIMFTYRGHYCKNFIEQIAFWKKRFFLGIFKFKFLQHALSADHGIDRLICDVMRQIQELKNRILCMLIPFLGSPVLLQNTMFKS